MSTRNLFFIIGLLIFVLSNGPAAAGSCTDGVDCYCDRVQGGDLKDPNLLLCEDFEAVTLHDNTNVGGEAPLYGPWYDNGADPIRRGKNSYWGRTYGPSVDGCSWQHDEPSSPKVGVTCKPGDSGVCWTAEWRADDLWQGNQWACIDIVRDGEFDDEISSLLEPSLASDGGTGTFDGVQSFAHRVGAGKNAGITGMAKFGGSYTTVGATMAMAYPTNSESSGIWNYPWKHNEWQTVLEGKGDPTFVFHNASGLAEDDPFKHSMKFANDKSQSDCEAALSKANIRRGYVFCVDVAMYYRADSNYYIRSRDWPFGTWGCARGHFQNLGTSNTSIKIWFNNTLIIDIDGLDGSFLSNREGYNALWWNNFSNANTPGLGRAATTQTTYRYEDNVHITAGPPVSCEQIGFVSSGGDITPPAVPTNLVVQ